MTSVAAMFDVGGAMGGEVTSCGCSLEANLEVGAFLMGGPAGGVREQKPFSFYPFYFLIYTYFI